MNAKEARNLMSGKKNDGFQLRVEAYMKWIYKSIEMAAEKGKDRIEIAELFKNFNSALPNSKTTADIQSKLTENGYYSEVGKDGLITFISW